MNYLKAYASLIGAIATALLGVFTADTTVGQVLTILAVIATAITTWAVPNVSGEPDWDSEDYLDDEQDGDEPTPEEIDSLPTESVHGGMEENPVRAPGMKNPHGNDYGY